MPVYSLKMSLRKNAVILAATFFAFSIACASGEGFEPPIGYWNCSGPPSGPFGPPAFLSDLSADQLDKICRIIFNFTATKDEDKGYLEQWKANQTTEIQVFT